jgi:uncharacterized delta-60 repeat protein
MKALRLGLTFTFMRNPIESESNHCRLLACVASPTEKRLNRYLAASIILSCMAGPLEIQAQQPGQMDTTFNAGTGAHQTGNALALEPDGNVLVVGYRIARLLPDGAPDPLFNQNARVAYGDARALAVEPGRVFYVGGRFAHVNGQPRPRLARLSLSGHLDETFTPFLSGDVNALLAQPDGKLLVAEWFNTVHNAVRPSLARLNRDGSLDTSFSFDGSGLQLTALELLPDGRILAGARSWSSSWLKRIHPDGAQDLSFQPEVPVGSVGSAVSLIRRLEEGRILVGGGLQIAAAGAPIYPGIARFHPDGPLDLSFTPVFANEQNVRVNAIEVQPDGKLLIAGEFAEIGGKPWRNLARLNANGTLDTSFNPGIGFNGPVNALALSGTDRVLAAGTFTEFDGYASEGIVLIHAGDAAPTEPRIEPEPVSIAVVEGRPYALHVRAVGNPLPSYHWLFNGAPMAGAGNNLIEVGAAELSEAGVYQLIASNALGVAMSEPITLHVSPAPTHPGAVDVRFQPAFDQKPAFGPFLALRNGNLIGCFSSVSAQGFSEVVVKEFDAQGSVIRSFPGGTRVFSILEQPDGKVLILSKDLLRYLPSGEIDPTFHTFVPAELILLVAWQPPDGILVVTKERVNGLNRYTLLRLRSNGELDEAFNGLSLANGAEPAMHVLKDGSILLDGRGAPPAPELLESALIKLHPDGTLDQAFPAAALPAGASLAAVRSDGKILVSQAPTSTSNVRQYHRLHPDGSLDETFQLEIERKGVLGASLVLDEKDNIVLAGVFEKVNGVVRRHLARVTRDGELDPTFDAKLGPVDSIKGGIVVKQGMVYVQPTFSSGTIDGVPVSGRVIRLFLDLRISSSLGNGNRFGLAVPTTAGVNYVVEATSSIENPDWGMVRELTGDGTLQHWKDDRASQTQQFYRVRASTVPQP